MDAAEINELTADDIFSADEISSTMAQVIVPEWKKNGKPGVLFLRVLSALELMSFQDSLKNEAMKRASWVRLFALCACDRNGTPLFKASDMEKLLQRSAAVFLRLQKKILEINGMAQPEKTWETVKGILESCGIDQSVIGQVQAKWNEDDPVGNA